MIQAWVIFGLKALPGHVGTRQDVIAAIISLRLLVKPRVISLRVSNNSPSAEKVLRANI